MRIAIPSPVLGSRRIQGSTTAIHEHLGQVERPIHTTRQVGHISVKADLLAQQLQILIFFPVLGNQVRPRRSFSIPSIAIGHPLVHTQRIAALEDLDAAGFVVRDPFERAVGPAGFGGPAQLAVDAAGCVEVVDFVQGAGASVKNDGCVGWLAAVGEGTFVGCESGVDFRDGGADLLGSGQG